jgi:hypothetical protein
LIYCTGDTILDYCATNVLPFIDDALIDNVLLMPRKLSSFLLNYSDTAVDKLTECSNILSQAKLYMDSILFPNDALSANLLLIPGEFQFIFAAL